MISHKHKVVFVHIPKVAGQSIENVFLKDLGLNWESRKPLLLMSNDVVENGPPRLAHLTSDEYVKLHYLSQELYNKYFKFAFVRNPWDRTVSFYKYIYSQKGINFKTFVKNVLPELVHKEDFFFRSQYKYIYINDKLNVDFVGRFENLDNDFNNVLDQIGINNAELLHKNRSRSKKIKNSKIGDVFNFYRKKNLNDSFHKPFTTYYDTELIDLVSNLYKKDIELFSYTFDN